MRSSVKVRLKYCFLLFLWAVFAAIMRDWAEPVFSAIPSTKIDNCAECVGVFVVFRVCFMMFTFHMVLSVAMIRYETPSEEPLRQSLQDGWFFVKFIIQCLLFGITILIPNDFFFGFAHFARGASCLYILIQVVLLVLMSYYINMKWVNKDPPWIKALIGSSIALYVASLVAIILMYVFYTREDGCGLNVAWVTITLIACIVLSLPALFLSYATPLTSGVVSLYLCFICWSALQSQPKTDSWTCNTLFNDGASERWVQAMGMMFALIVSVWVAFRTGSRESDDPFDEIPNDELDYTPPYFHLVFALAAAYIAMVLSNWEIRDTPKLSVDMSMTSAWVKIVSQWVTALLYAWTLAAPLVLRGREFWWAPMDGASTY